MKQCLMKVQNHIFHHGFEKTAGRWGEEMLSDDEFVGNIQWMIDNNFIKR